MLVPFPNRYHDARRAFFKDAEALGEALGIDFEHRKKTISADEDLTIDALLYHPPETQRLLVLVSGTHGLEGYTGSAIQRHLMAGPLRHLKTKDSGLLIVHGLNPWGFDKMRRVNPNNVDLNRNFEDPEGPLYAQDSSDYEGLEKVLCPQDAYGGGAGALLRFGGGMIKALVSKGMGPLRQATLSGQYSRPKGIFYGGSEPQPESLFFMELYRELAPEYGEILLCDIHTGYGERGLAYPLFGRGDSPEFKEYTAEGVRSEGGDDKTYTATGDLIGWAHKTAKALHPKGIFDGLVVEMGTHGLGTVKQLKDLWAVVRENQVHHFGAPTSELKLEAQRDFKALFFPEEPDWQEDVLHHGGAVVEGFLKSRGFVQE